MPAVLRFESGPAQRRWTGAMHGTSGLWRSLVARFVWDEDVAGSNPVSPTYLESRGISKDRPKACPFGLATCKP